MRDWIARHRLPIVVALLLLLPLPLMYVHGRAGHASSPAQRASMDVAGLAQQGAGALFGGVSTLVSDYLALVDLREDNLRLTAENERLMAEALTAKQLAVENLELRGLLGLAQARRELETAPARVIARELTPYYRVARVAVELPEGLRAEPDMAVVTPLGLLGRVVQGTGGLGDVMLLTDGRSRIAAEVLGRGILGMVVGRGRPDERHVRLQVGLNEAPLEDGTVIVTSGHDQVFPRGIEVGYVSNAEERHQGSAYMEYDVTLSVNPGAVTHAMVVLSRRPRDATGR